MFSSAVIDTVTGLVFVLAATSLLCTALLEWISNYSNQRGEYLLKGLREMLDLPPAAPGAVLGAAVPTTDEGVVRLDLADRGGRRQELNRLSGVGAGLAQRLRTAPAGSVTPEPYLADLVLAHPVVASLHRPVRPGVPAGTGGRVGSKRGNDQMRLASYLSGRTFAKALIDLLASDGAGRTSVYELREQVAKLDVTVPARAALLSLLSETGSDVAAFCRELERWYDEQMARVSGWYKRWAQWRLLIAGLVLAVAVDIDMVQVGKALYSEQAVRQVVVAQAASAQQRCAQDAAPQDCVRDQTAALRDLPLPIGWDGLDDGSGEDVGAAQLLQKLVGWLLTGVGVSFGAPFWFDALSKLGSLRTAGRRPGDDTTTA